MLKGIDISNYQPTVDYARVKNSGVQAAYIKASEGQGYKDRLTGTHYTGLKGQGISVGFYHFFKPSIDAVAQAQNFADVVKRYPSDLIHMCDIETTEGKDKDFISNAVIIFINKVKELTGNDCGVYTGSSFSKNNLTNVLSGTKLWLAHYTSGQPSWNTNIWPSWSGWQYSSSGQVNGIFGNVDVNQFGEDLFINGAAPIAAQSVPLGNLDDFNAVVQNDWFFTRDQYGNQEEGHKVDIGDKIKILDISYSKQLDLVEYPIPGGTRQAYIKNVVANLQFRRDAIVISGYRDVLDRFTGAKIGSINNERVIILEDLGDKLNIAYSTDKGEWTKSGVIQK